MINEKRLIHYWKHIAKKIMIQDGFVILSRVKKILFWYFQKIFFRDILSKSFNFEALITNIYACTINNDIFDKLFINNKQ